MKNVLIIIIPHGFFSCNLQNENPQKNNTKKSAKALRILENQGFDISKIEVCGEDLILDGDGILSIKTVLSKGLRSKQWSTRYTMTESNAKDIKLRIHRKVPNEWKEATRNAIRNWNSVEGSSLRIREVTKNEDLLVIYQRPNKFDYPEITIAQAEFPDEKGRVGSKIRINQFFDTHSMKRKERTMTHEIGHTIGLRHTDWNKNNGKGDTVEEKNGAQHIPGTPKGAEITSVMNRGQGYQEWNGLTDYDKIAIRYLYPIRVSAIKRKILGPDIVASKTTATFTSPYGRSYQWWYQIKPYNWQKWPSGSSQKLRVSHKGTMSLSVKVDGKFYFKNDIIFK